MEEKVISTLLMDRGYPLGNSLDVDSRRALHVLIKNSNAIPVAVGNSDALSLYGQALSVPNASETPILTYTVPLAKKFKLSHVEVEGDNVGAFRVQKNSITIARARFGYTVFFQKMDFSADSLGLYTVAAGDVLVVSVLQENRDSMGNYSARFVGVLQDA